MRQPGQAKTTGTISRNAPASGSELLDSMSTFALPKALRALIIWIDLLAPWHVDKQYFIRSLFHV